MKLHKILTACLLVAMVMTLCLVAVPTKAEAATDSDFTYTVTNGEATITGYTGAATNLTIPATLGGYPVTTIGYQAFYNCPSLTSVTIGNSVTAIGYQAFYYCYNLTSVTIRDSVKSIGYGAFYYCYNLISVTIGDSVASIGNYAFSNCNSLKSVTIPDSVTTIGDHAFSWCTSLTSVTIPGSVTTIGDGAFSACDSLTEIWVSEGNMYYSNDAKGVLFNKDKTELIQAPGAISGSYVIPDSVTAIGCDAFYNCTSLTGVTIPGSVTTIGHSAFRGCSSLKSVTIPGSVTTIGNWAFYWCTSLESMTIPGSVTTIGDYAFSDCNSLKSVTIPGSVTTIGFSAFYNCASLKSVTIPDSVTSIDSYAFRGCSSLTSVTIPNSVTTIDDNAFYNCTSLGNVYYAGTQTQWSNISIGSYNSDLTNATIHYQHIHDYSLIPPEQVDPTCTEDGYIEYTCAYGDTYRKILPALGHAVGTDAVVTAPTCVDRGYTTSTCLRCNCLCETNYVSALGHDYNGTVTVVPPTCAGQGYTQTQCIRCDSVRMSDYTDMIAHKMVLLPAVSPTCTEPGLSAGTACQYCGMVGVAQKEVAANGHSYVDHEGKAPTCTESGWEAYQTCENCDLNTYEALPALGHRVYMETIILVDPLTVTNNGTVPFTVTDGTYYSANHTDNSVSEFMVTAEYDCVLNLTYGVSSESGCDRFYILLNGNQQAMISGSVSGMTMYLQLSAGDVVTFRYSKDISVSNGDDCGWVKLEYNYVEIWGMGDVPADTLEPDCANSVTCSYCGVVVKNAPGHSYVDHVAKAPTCTEIGWEAYKTCKNCDYTDYQELPIIDHSYVEHEAKAPTCAEIGWEAYQTCENCDYSTYAEIPATDHSFSNYISNNDATVLADGTKTAKCDNCDATDTITDVGSKISAVATGTCGDNLTWWLGSDGTLIVSGTGDMEIFDYNLDVCETITPWKRYSEEIKRVVIEDGVTSISLEAFCYCKNLQSVTIGNSVTIIGSGAFGDCTSLQSVTIPDSVITIDNWAFSGCQSLESVTIGNSVTTIGRGAFDDCSSLTDVYYVGTQAQWNAISIDIYNDALTDATIYYLGDYSYTVSNGEATITGYTGSATNLIIPTTLGGYPVTTIGDRAFYNCYSLTSVTIPDSVITIGNSAFNWCDSLISVTIGNSVTSIGDSAFGDCQSLQDITIPNSVTTIGDQAFIFCYALESVTIPDSVTTIGDGAFYDCYSLAGIWVSEGNAYYSSDAKGVLFNKDKTELIQVPYAINGSYTIPDSVTTIGKHAFDECENLTSVTIPDSVTTIGDYAFDGCNSLTDVYYGGNQTQWNAISIGTYNDALTSATIHFACDHVYTADPTTCGICGFVRVSLQITNVTLRPSAAGIYFKGEFTLSAGVTAQRYGIAVSVENALPVADDSDAGSLYTSGEYSVLVSDILDGDADDAQNGRKLIYARTYVLLEDGTYIYGDTVVTNLQTLVETVDTKWDNLSGGQKVALADMYSNFSAVMDQWDVFNMEHIEYCPCGCDTLADAVVWYDANAYIATLAQLTENNTKIVESVHLRLSTDLNITEIYGAKKQIAIGDNVTDVNVTIDLNGYTWYSDYRMYNYEGCVLTFMDTSELQTGTMISTGSGASASGGVFINYGTLNIRGGTYTQPANGSKTAKGGVVYQSSGEFNFYGGTIIGGQAIENGTASGVGGNVYIRLGTFNMYGGSIIGGTVLGTAGTGGNVYIAYDSVFNMYGGVISGGVAAVEPDIYLNDEATFNNVGGTVGTP